MCPTTVTSPLTLADDPAVRGSQAAGWPSPLAPPLAPLLYRSPPSLFPVPHASPSLKQEQTGIYKCISLEIENKRACTLLKYLNKA